MDRIRYNISQQYGVDKGISLKMLCDKMPNDVYRKIMQSYVKSVIWRYKIEEDFRVNPSGKGEDIKILEVELREKVATELIMEMIAGMFSGYYVVVFRHKEEIALGAAREVITAKNTKEIVATAFLQYDASRKLTIIDYEKDNGKNNKEIFERIMKEIRMKKKEIQMRDALHGLRKVLDAEKQRIQEEMLASEFSTEKLNQIRKDTEYVQSRLVVEHIDRGA